MNAERSAGFPFAELRWLARVPIDPMTYRSLGYLLLAFPLAIAYFTIIVVGISLGLGLTVVLVGPLILAATLLVIVAFAWFDGALAHVLLGAEIDPKFPSNDSLGQFLRDLFLGQSTWLGLAFILWKIALGFIAFTLILVGLSVGIALLLTPVYYGNHVVLNYGVGRFAIDSFSSAIVAGGIGMVVTYLTLLCINVLGLLSRAVAEGLLQHGAVPTGDNE